MQANESEGEISIPAIGGAPISIGVFIADLDAHAFLASICKKKELGSPC